ncbi:MAG: hypothetical protein COA78_25305 [Blastopirellula sp.]|nr:MAG: hypothetical protein COA78_25305 [Blastopirellula sp.]
MSQLNAAFPIVEGDLTMTQAFRDQMNILNGLIPLRGSGSPEGALKAPQFSEYIDTAGTASAIKYVKRDTDIAGDKTKGWILI